jgi:hypothetical protein
VHPASYTVDTGALSPMVKRPKREADYRGKKIVDVYIHSSIRFHGLVVN